MGVICTIKKICESYLHFFQLKIALDIAGYVPQSAIEQGDYLVCIQSNLEVLFKELVKLSFLLLDYLKICVYNNKKVIFHIHKSNSKSSASRIKLSVEFS